MSHARVLLVDDDPTVHQTVGEWLRHAGYETTVADSPAAAELARTGLPFDIIVSDIQMPGNHRLQWIDRILREPDPIPVVLITGDPQLETAMKAANLRVAAYLVKPVNFAELAQKLEQLVQHRRRRAALRELAGDVSRLLSRQGSAPFEPAVQEKLGHLARCLDGDLSSVVQEAGDSKSHQALRAAVTDAVETLRRTKGSFHSKELGALRRRLEGLSEAKGSASHGDDWGGQL